MTRMPAAFPPRPTTPLTRFLIGDTTAEPGLDGLRATGLVGHAFTRLPQHARRAELREGFLYTAARHVTVRRMLATLLAAWNGAGVIPLTFKGFHLAEFVYPAPGHRAYADIDLLVGEGDVPTACEVAAAQGWDVAWHIAQPDGFHALHGPEYLGHEAAHLKRADGDVMIDLHRRIVHNIHNYLPPEPVTQRLTDAILASSDTVAWEGVHLRVPRPVDAVVFGLALNRCWGSDAWRIKPRDYADMEALVQRFGVTRRAVLGRAAELGVARTVTVYLDRCDPERKLLDTRSPGWWALRAWNLAASRERGPIHVRRARIALADVAADAVALTRALPVVADTWRHLRLAAGWMPVVPARPRHAHRPIGSRAWRRLRRAVHRSMRLLRIADADREALGVLSAFRLLHARGVPVTLVSDGTNGRQKATPRVMYEGQPLRAYVGGDAED